VLIEAGMAVKYMMAGRKLINGVSEENE